MYEQVIDQLRQSYQLNAPERDKRQPQRWKVVERALFLDYLQREGKQKLLEIGAGPGRDSAFFQQEGLQVVCTDLSPAMVELCREKGLEAYVMDFLQLDFAPESFDAIYALNCLLHVPKADLPIVLDKLYMLLRSEGLFFLGLYGGRASEGVWEDDPQTIKRFFAYYTDEQIKAIVAQWFEIIEFRPIPLEQESTLHFQSIILRKTSAVQQG